MAKILLSFDETAEKVPNKVTLKAMKDAEQGKNLKHYPDSNDMFEKLGI